MPERPSRLKPLLTNALLFVLASPVLAVQALGQAFKRHRANAVVRNGFVRCPSCGRGNRLDVLVTCPACSFAEFRSLAQPCSECSHQVRWISCTGCGASVRLP